MAEGVGVYSLADAARILRISPGRLRYWRRTRLVEPSTRGADLRRGLGFDDLVSLRAVVSLVDRGVPVRRIRRTLRGLRERVPELEQPLRSLRIWGELGPRVVARHGEAWIEPDGQLVLDFEGPEAGSPVAPLVREGSDAEAGGPRSALEWFERGCELDADPSTFRAAAEAYRRAIALDPALADAHCNLGTLFYNRGERGRARRHYEDALVQAPGHLEAHFNLANLLEEEGQGETALRHYKRALLTDPLFPDAHLNLALLYEKLGLPRRARQHWRRYLQILPDGNWADVARQRLEERES